ncbi:MAG: hypothetical protein OXF02_06775 [Simkaniaceae bacterium]|nr:hypothetical protein [Simkaniaceae bacterium]
MALAVGEGQGVVRPEDRVGTAIPLRLDEPPSGSLPGRRQGRFTGEERRGGFTPQEQSRLLDYALEMRDIRLLAGCTGEVGVPVATLSRRMRAECMTYPAFSNASLSGRILRPIDYGRALVDLRAGKDPVSIYDYVGVADDCAEASLATISARLKAECMTYRVVSDLVSDGTLDSRTLQAIDYRKLWVDLRTGKDPTFISDSLRTGKYSERTRKMEFESVPNVPSDDGVR